MPIRSLMPTCSRLALLTLTALAGACDYPVGADVTFELDATVAPPSLERRMLLVVEYEEVGRSSSPLVDAEVICDADRLVWRWWSNGCPPELTVEARLVLVGDAADCRALVFDAELDALEATGELVAASDRHVLWEGEGVVESTYRCQDLDTSIEVTLPLHAVSGDE